MPRHIEEMDSTAFMLRKVKIFLPSIEAFGKKIIIMET
jgi:hypothetical protein